MKIQDIKKRNWNSLNLQEKELYCSLDGSDLNFMNMVASKQNVNVYYTPELSKEEQLVVEEYFRVCSINDME